LKRHAITITAAALGLVGLAAFGAFLFYVTDLAPLQVLLGAFVALLGAFVALLLITMVTNTRRPYGVDPNAAPPHRARSDPFAATTDELRQPVLLPDAKPYGRRNSDDAAVVARLIDRLEQDDAQRPPPANGTPKWALDLIADSEAAGLHIPAPPDEMKES